MKEMMAVRAYESAIAALLKFCKENTELQAVVQEEKYPFSVQFIPDPQLSMFPEENVDEGGEIRTMTISVGLTTKIRSKLKMNMEKSVLKKLIRLTEGAGLYYYQAFRQKAAAEKEE